VTRSPARRFRGDRAFTLIDTVMAVGLTATIMGVLAAAIMVTLGPDQDALDRSTSSHDGQMASVWFPPDLASAGPVDPVSDLAPAATLTCVGATPGTNVLRLGWNQPVPVSTNTAVSYRLVHKGVDWQLVRYVCTNGGNASAHVIVEKLQSPSSVHVALAGRKVTVAFTTALGQAYSIGAARRTPDPLVATSTTVPPTTTTSTTTTLPPTTTTTVAPTTTTTVPATPCVVTSVTNPFLVFRTTSRYLSGDVAVVVTTTGTCTGLRLSYVTSSDSPTVLTLTKVSATTWTVTIPGQGSTGAETWTSGSKTLSVLPASGTTAYATTGSVYVL
jgi:hypothetical protein